VEIFLASFVITIVGGLALNVYLKRYNRRYQQFRSTLVKQRPSYLSSYIAYEWAAVGKTVDKHWQGCTFMVTAKGIAIYRSGELLLTIQKHELRGFWRHPNDYIKRNELWIHAQIDLTWSILKVSYSKQGKNRLFRAISAISTEEQRKAHHRPPPYIHRGPTKAFPAQQSLTGEWEMGDAIRLYLMPLYLVIFAGDEVQRTIDLSKIQEIAALKRMEGGNPAGLIRFRSDEEDFAFALNNYEAWANDLAEAAKRSLEEPVIRKRKGKDDEWDWDDEDEFATNGT